MKRRTATQILSLLLLLHLCFLPSNLIFPLSSPPAWFFSPLLLLYSIFPHEMKVNFQVDWNEHTSSKKKYKIRGGGRYKIRGEGVEWQRGRTRVRGKGMKRDRQREKGKERGGFFFLNRNLVKYSMECKIKYPSLFPCIFPYLFPLSPFIFLPYLSFHIGN